jgi:micrococcal nuclease
VIDGNQTKIRLWGIDAPERAQPLGKESKAFLEKLTLGKEAIIAEMDRDQYGRIVAEVFVSGQGEAEIFVNADLVGAGLA